MPRLSPAAAPLTGALLLAAFALFGRDARRLVLSAWSEYSVFRPAHAAVPRPPDAAALGLRDVALPVAGVGTVRGWYAPSRNGAAVVLAHGSGGDRREVLDAARALAGGGYGVLLFDWPGHGESEGVIRFGAPERRTLAAAVAHAARQPDVDPRRVGVYGFSIGALLAAQVAADDPAIRAVVLAASPTSVDELTRHEYAAKGRAALWGAVLGDRLGGLRPDDPQPIAVVRRIAPRPLLILTGTADGTVPPAMARALYAAAGDPKRLWLVDGAGHGGYGQAAPGFGAEIRGFFDGALAPGAAGPRR